MFSNLSAGAIGVGGTLEELLGYAKAGGFGGLDLNISQARQKADEGKLDEVRAAYEGAGLKMGGWGLPVDFRGEEEKFQEGLADLPALAAVGQDLGCTRVPTWILPFHEELSFEENYALHQRRLRACAEVLADHGCALGLEFVGPKTMRQGKQHEFIYDMPGMLALCDDIGTGNVGLLLDCWHWYTSHGTLDQITALQPEQVVYVHVNDAPEGVPVDEQIDNVRTLPGETGVIDIKGFLCALEQIGYDGPVTPEPFSQKLREMAPEQAVRATGESMRRIFELAGITP